MRLGGNIAGSARRCSWGARCRRSLVFLRCAHAAVTPAPACTDASQTGEVSAAAGAGIYFEERRGLLTSLWLLLQAQVRARARGSCCFMCTVLLPLLLHGCGGGLAQGGASAAAGDVAAAAPTWLRCASADARRS